MPSTFEASIRSVDSAIDACFTEMNTVWCRRGGRQAARHPERTDENVGRPAGRPYETREASESKVDHHEAVAFILS